MTIESVRIEDHTLIVQARHLPNKPILIQAVNLANNPEFEVKQMHFFYDGVGRYTARFGPLSSLTETTPFTLEVHSVKRIKDSVPGLTRELTFSPTQNDTAFDLKKIEQK